MQKTTIPVRNIGSFAITHSPTSKNNEEMLTGRTDSNKVVIFEGSKDLVNQIIELKIVSQHMWYLKGEK